MNAGNLKHHVAAVLSTGYSIKLLQRLSGQKKKKILQTVLTRLCINISYFGINILDDLCFPSEIIIFKSRLVALSLTYIRQVCFSETFYSFNSFK